MMSFRRDGSPAKRGIALPVLHKECVSTRSMELGLRLARGPQSQAPALLGFPYNGDTRAVPTARKFHGYASR